MASPTDIANAALALLSDARIEDIQATPSSPQSDLVSRFYPLARDAILAMTDWSFCTGWQALPRLAEPPAANWRFQYALPETPLAVVTIWELSDPLEEWERAFDPTTGQQVVYTNMTRLFQSSATPATVIPPEVVATRLTYQQTNTALWSPLAVQALVYKLAADMALSRTGQSQKWNQMMDGMRLWLDQATAKDGKTRFKTIQPTAGMLRVRGGGGRR